MSMNSEALNPQDYILGKSVSPLVLNTLDDNRSVSSALVSQATHTLCIASRMLDPRLYNNSAFCDAVAKLASLSRYSRIRALVRDPEPLIKNGHCLVELSRRLSSSVEIRLYGPDHRAFNESFLVVDGIGYVHNELSDRYTATANFNDKTIADALTRKFQEMWDHSIDDPQLRRLHI
jgi:hypothetical protein